MAQPAISVRHDREHRRFEADIDGRDTGAVMKYRVVDDRTLDYYSTFTPKMRRGRGIADRIVTEALEYAMAKGLRVVPTCPYVAKVIERNPRFHPLMKIQGTS